MAPDRFRTVLVANRGEIAVRIVRACRDAGLRSVAVYAEQDRDAPHVRLADEAQALGGSTARDSYLSVERLLAAAARGGADAVHPGYGFLAENAGFARAVQAAGLVWIGPPPGAIDALGDKVTARQLAEQVGAPLVPGTREPVAGAAEVEAFAAEHGLPVAIKAAFGGGGRGLRVARTAAEIPALFESAVREATAAFGRGECFVERFLDRPRHLETQCLADVHGTVVVVSTRDCSVQRRNQKLVEEAPAPWLTEDQRAELARASKAILRAAGYVGAGTCEFLLGPDGTLTFLEVNTRLQVEHCVSEEVTGIDLVREQFRLAAGEPLGYDDPPARGHSIEFRINGEDAARGFLPGPGTVTGWRPPSGPGVRVDAGVAQGSVVDGSFDSLLAKLIVTGRDRTEALQRARRALAEFEVDGLATVLPFHRALVADPAFAPDRGPFSVHTRWIETEWSNSEPARGLEPWSGDPTGADGASRERIVVEVNGKRLEVSLPAGLSAAGGPPPAAPRRAERTLRAAETSGQGTSGHGTSGQGLTAPMQGTVVSVATANGATVAEGDLILVMEAMKMEQPITAHRAGTVSGLSVSVGQTLASGTVLCTIQ